MRGRTTLIAAEIPSDLAAEARDLVGRIREHEDPAELREEGAAMVLELTRAGLDAFFLDPVERLGLGTMTRSMVKVGLGSAAKAIGVFVNRVVGSLSEDQVVEMAELVDRMLIETGEGASPESHADPAAES